MRGHRSPDRQHSRFVLFGTYLAGALSRVFHLNSGASDMNSGKNGKNGKNLGWLGQGLALVTLSVALAGCGGSSDASATGSGAAAAGGSPSVSGTPFSAAGSSTSSSGGSGTASASGASPSATGTTIPSSAGKIVDSAHNVWTVAGGVVYENGKTAGYSANVSALHYSAGTVYQQNKSCRWWYWNGSTWVSTSNPAPSTTPACPASTASAGSSPSSSSSGGSSASGSHGTAAALLAYINGLQGQTRHILLGQHSNYWDANPLDDVQAATSQTGKTVAILGTTTGQSGSTENVVSLTNAWLAQGGIPLVSWWPLDPFTGIVDNDRSIDLAQLTQPGTAPYIAWYKLMDEQIALLKQINGPVLYRPFVELNGNWSWWGQKDPATFQLVWQQMHDYFASKGVTNVLWLYNVNEDLGNYTVYYPGSSYVDVVSWDSYPPDGNDGGWYSGLATLGKPIILAECGIVGDYSGLPALVKANYPLVKAIVVWSQKWALSVNSGASAFMNDPSTIAMSDLPSGLVNP